MSRIEDGRMASDGDCIADRYTLREMFTLGGEGLVWRATDEVLGRDVVLKCPRTGDTGGAQVLRVAARNAAGLRHPNIVGVLDIFECDGVLWLVTEYVPGASLAENVRQQRKLGISQTVAVGAQIASALAHCHDNGILHCDVSPENIILTPDGDARLTDFGSSLDLRAAGTGERPKADAARGKWRYAAPELGRDGLCGPKADVYALGASLLAVSGPRRGPGALDALLAQLTQSNPSLRPTAVAAADAFARLEQAPRDLDRTLLRRVLLGAALLCAVALTVAAGVAMPADGPADPLGDPRTADPCALLDPAVLADFGRIDMATDQGNFDTCDLRVRLPGEDFHPEVGRVRLTLSGAPPPEQGSHAAVTRVGDLAIVSEPPGNTRCTRALTLSDDATIEILGQRKPGGPDPCALADAVTGHVREMLARGPIPRRSGEFPADSLARHDACAQLDVPTLSKVPGLDALRPVPGFGNWSCRWNSTIDSHVTVRYDRDPPKTAVDGQPLVLAGLPSFRRAGVTSTDECTVQIQYRDFTGISGDELAEIAVVRFGGAPTPELRCATATELATTVAASLVR
ncbi:protein kinase [Nocardia brasiliensis]|nr:protein kinase [Nocardia brasiliensis]